MDYDSSVPRILEWHKRIRPYISNITREDMTIYDRPASWGNHPEYRVVVAQNGALSFGTQQIDTLDMVNNILTDKAKKEYVDSNRDILEEQAKSFYTSIVQSVSPDTKLNFIFKQAEGS